jgi:lysophospholipase L1-like esterase
MLGLAAAAALTAVLSPFAPSAALAQASTTVPAAADAFAIRDGDRVCFYGDSITDQRMYSLLAEDFIVTRFPRRNVSFVHSGWGGDRVTGGGGGPINVRLDRDVIAYKPTVVTIMLGMNDASYRAYDESIFQTYAKGYEAMVAKLKKDLPGVRLTLIQPSPFDDVTRAPGWDPGYNTVLVRYGTFLRDLAGREGAGVADLNTPVVAMLQKANAADNALAQKIIPDHVHPGWGGHLVMAEALLRAWGAPSVVSSVGLDFKAGKATALQNARVEGVKREKDGSLAWTATEDALPFPLLNYQKDPAFALALRSSEFVDALDRQTLTVANLPKPAYMLKIDGAEVGTFTRESLQRGVNLALLDTPMHRQALEVDGLTRRRTSLHNLRWRTVQVPAAGTLANKALADEFGEPFKALSDATQKLMTDIDARAAEVAAQQRAAAQPKPHTFTLSPAPFRPASVAAR